MSAQPRQITYFEAWSQWENQVVGAFPLRRLLGCTDHSGVFLTEHKGKDLAAIKFVRADGLHGKAQLVQWQAAALLSHPHLVRLFGAGRYRSGGHEFLFVVMEHAEQNLAEILSRRALSPDEVRELLLPTLDALAFLHRNQRVHAQLKPSNFLAVNDQLKLASDTIRPAGHSASDSTASDVWDLGTTLVEALTQHTMAWSDQQGDTASLPEGVPAPLADMVRRCLDLTPAHRPTVTELEQAVKDGA